MVFGDHGFLLGFLCARTEIIKGEISDPDPHLNPNPDPELEEKDFRWVTDKILSVANVVCDGRVVSCLEGL